jgi:hypothetical protein
VVSIYKRANLSVALFCFVFLRRKYLNLVTNHKIAINLESEKYKIRFENGTYPSENCATEELKIAKDGADGLQKRIISSFCSIIVCSIVAITAGLFTQTINFGFNLSCNKLFAFVGTFLVSWATIMVLGGELDTWGGETLHELLCPFVFKVLFIPGAFLLLTSIVI